MSLRFYDTAARGVREFVPLQDGRASIYVCGPTPQALPHLGHVRSAVVFDVLRRWLTVNGYDVTFVRNVTDIDDKILAKGEIEARPWWAVASFYERAFTAAYDTLGVLPPTIEPRATGHIPEMVTLIRRLIDAGHAYPADGDVYFDVPSFPAYGSLTHQGGGDTQTADSPQEHRKRNPRDFALWKGAKPGEPSWETPWGDGRPGWHIECSAMATRYLGPVFDIHGGGLDLVFPHHENEIAQSNAAGDGFARYWLHNSWVTQAGEKMSKSLGNTLSVHAITARIRPIELRYYLLGAHYRSTVEVSFESLEETAAAFRRIEHFLARGIDALGPVPTTAGRGPEAFARAMDDDLAVPAALAVLHDTVRAGNAALDGGSTDAARAALGEVSGMLATLGVNPLVAPWDDAGSGLDSDRLRAVIDRLVAGQLTARAQARERKDFAAADAIRDGLKAAGILIEDGPDGSRWTMAGD